MLQYYGLVGLILLQAAVIFFNGTSDKKRKIFCIICGIELACILGLRSVNVGIDTFNYANAFRELSASSFASLFGVTIYFEKGFVLFCKMLSLISSNPQILFIASGIIVAWGTMNLICKNTKMVWLAVIIYISAVGDFSFSFNIMRQTIAIAFIMFSFEPLTKRRPFVFLFWVLLASAFHRTAFCFLVAYPFYNIKFNIRNFILVALGAALVFINMKPILNFITGAFPVYQTYLESEGLDYITDVLIKSCILLFAVIISQYKSTDKTFNILLWFAFFALIFAVFNFKFYLFIRFELYFSAFVVILMPKTFELIGNKMTKIIFLSSFLFFTFLYTQRAVTHIALDLNYLPYEFFWQNPAGERKWNFTDGYMPW